MFLFELSMKITAAWLLPCPGRTQTNLFCFCRRRGKWVRLFWHFRHGAPVPLQALVSMEMKNSVCHVCSWFEFQTLGSTSCGKARQWGAG